MKRWLILCLLFLALSGCAAPCSDDPACTSILFIGNSYTFANDLPGTIAKLARSGKKRLETGMAASGGWTLADHANSAETLEQIKSSKWTYVVLQEQSQIPAHEQMRTRETYPAARSLAAKIREAGATPVLFVTWAHREGWPDVGIPTYEKMQLQINGGYLALGQELRALISPVGFAWLKLWRQNPQLELWEADGSHPNEKGTYLAACVFYTMLYQQSPEGLTYTGSLSKEEAQLLQKIAAETVLNEPGRWNLP